MQLLAGLATIQSLAVYVPRDTAGCVSWQSASSLTGDAFAAMPAGSAMCRRSEDRIGSGTDSFRDVRRTLPVGVYDAVKRQCTIMGTSTSGNDIELAVVNTTHCDVWWRYSSQDQNPPVPAMTLQFGTSGGPENTLYGICRSRGKEVRLGTLIFNGPNVANCIIPADKQTGWPELTLRFGDYDTIEAQPLSGCTDDAQLRETLKLSLESKLDEFLTADDHEQIARISGHDYTSLEAGVLALGSCDLSKILSAGRFIPHDLNRLGLVSRNSCLVPRNAQSCTLSICSCKLCGIH